MRLILSAFSIYWLGIYYDLCSKIFDKRVEQRIYKNAPLTDRITISMSNMCWHYKLKLKIAEAEFETKRLAFLNPTLSEN